MKDTNKKSLPAFPQFKDLDYNHEGIILEPEQGITKREYFAGLAMQGLTHQMERYDSKDGIKLMCADAIGIADELLNQLKQK